MTSTLRSLPGRRRRPVRLAAAVAGIVVLAVMAGCGGDPAPEAGVSPLADCAGLTAPPPEAGPAVAGAAQPVPAASLPPVRLPCFTGGEPFALAELRGPAVVNLWASWCRPCRDELPALQAYADQTSGKVHVVGVVTSSNRTAAVALADQLGIRFPSLEDRGEDLLAALGLAVLPVTLFVDRDGAVAFVHRAEPYDGATLAGLVRRHLGVGT